MRDLINHDDEMICPECNGVGRVMKCGKPMVVEPAKNCPECLNTGFVGDNSAGKRYNNEYLPCDVCAKGKQLAGEVGERVSNLTVSELFELIVKAVKECKKQDVEQSEAEYKRLTTKNIVVMDISTRDGKPVPQEY